MDLHSSNAIMNGRHSVGSHRVQAYHGDMATAGTMLALMEKASESPDNASTTLDFRHRQSFSDPGAARAGSGTPGISHSHNPSILQNSTGWPCRYSDTHCIREML